MSWWGSLEVKYFFGLPKRDIRVEELLPGKGYEVPFRTFCLLKRSIHSECLDLFIRLHLCMS